MNRYFIFILTFTSTILMALFLFMFGLTSYNSIILSNYQAQVEQIISHAGGLNQGAKLMADQLSKEHFHGMYSVSSNDVNVGFHKPISYTVSANIPIKLNISEFSHPIIFTNHYTTRSQIRQNSQDFNSMNN
ncbi:hypothetical protein DY052_09145 [Apilactobacillus timberlakei]|uniref:hypothetical protein n=1 Tax=Apilactobacillus timberlakei TaxID=2008380 RepID=UPI00112CCE10|nr:hypothetical protein [Apilactobacillus timberlakei]TPR12814.1 hypothetical protein DY052_09145 [Apilactobacillus timberlakei]